MADFLKRKLTKREQLEREQLERELTKRELLKRKLNAPFIKLEKHGNKRYIKLFIY